MNQKKFQNVLIVVLCVITVVCLCVTGWAVFLRPAQTETPDYAPVELEPNAEPADEDPADASAAPQVAEGGGSVTLSYTKSIKVIRTTRTVELYYQNPSSSYNNVSLQVVLVDKNGQEVVIAQSGLLAPGSKITSLPLSTDINLPTGEYSGRFEVGFYDPKSGEKAIVNSKVESLTIDVQ